MTTPTILFGLGPEADGALKQPLVADAPVGMLTSWFNGTGDLSWMTGWAANLIPTQYAAGRALHLIVYASDATISATSTKYGTANGRAYPLSAQFQTDMVALAKTWAGPAGGPPLYVTLFTEFQTYAATPSAWFPEVAYWRALKDAYTAARATFRQYAPNARVSLGWGGWQARSDDPVHGGGRSMFPYFADVMAASDFQSFQAMQSDTNVSDALAMAAILGRYGPVLLAHYKPDNSSQSVFESDTSLMLTDGFLAQAASIGLFAWSFMDAVNMNAVPADYSAVVAAVNRYAKPLPPAGYVVTPSDNIPALIAAGHSVIVMRAGTYKFSFGSTDRTDAATLIPYGDGQVVIDGTGLDQHFLYVDGDITTDDGFEIAGPGVKGDNTSQGLYGHGPVVTGTGRWHLGAMRLQNFVPSNSGVVAWRGTGNFNNPYVHGVPGSALQTYRGTASQPTANVTKGRLGGMYESCLAYSGTINFSGTAFTEPTAAWDIQNGGAVVNGLSTCTGTGPNGTVRHYP